MEKLTVFTPTYNRAYCLENAYKALCKQSSKEFIWLIIDDGSTDGTGDLVNQWKKNDNGFEIQYVYKENGGLYTGYNEAITRINTELCVCVDSDDYLVDNAVERILSFWEENGSNQYAGIVALDCTKKGTVIGDYLPNQKTINLIDLAVGKYKINNGDRKNIVRTELYKKVAPMKVFPGERDFNPHYLHLKISKDYDFLVMNEKVCVVEYQPDGMTNTVFKQYLRSPKSFREMRLLDLTLDGAPPGFLIKKSIHYVSSCILSGEPCIATSPRKILTILCYPFGIVLTIYLKLYQAKI